MVGNHFKSPLDILQGFFKASLTEGARPLNSFFRSSLKLTFRPLCSFFLNSSRVFFDGGMRPSFSDLSSLVEQVLGGSRPYIEGGCELVEVKLLRRGELLTLATRLGEGHRGLA